MRIGIDLRFTSASHMGTGTYAETAALALCAALEPGDEVIGFVDAPVTGPLATALRQVVLPHRVAGRNPADALRLLFDAAIDRANIEVFWSPAGIAPLVSRCAVVITIHDLWFEQEPAHYHPDLLRYLRQEIPRSVQAADGIIAISSATAADLVSRYHPSSDRIQVIPQKLRALFRKVPDPTTAQQGLNAVGLDGPFVLTLTNHAPHKNTAFALSAVAAWWRASGNTTHRLVVAGGGPAPQAPEDLEQVARDLGIADRVVWAGRVPDIALPSLMARASAFLFPSLHEGWGLPPLEAMAMGTPAIVSNRGGLPEAVGDAALVLPLEQPQAWADALGRLVAQGPSPAMRQAMVARTTALQQPSGSVLRTALAMARERYLQQPMPARPALVADSPASPALAVPARPDPARKLTGISGCTILRNGVALDYPFLASVASYAPICDEIIVCWDPTSTDSTRELVEECARQCPQVRLVESPWDMTNRTGGTELARQTQIAFGHCRCPWTLYIQADEALHEDDHAALLRLIADPGTAGVGFERRSFLGTLDVEITEHHVGRLVRLFRTGRGISAGDAMECQVAGTGGHIVVSNARLFNYSRMGSGAAIATRTSNLNRFYHTDERVAALAEEGERLETAPFRDRHPAPIETLYRPGPLAALHAAPPSQPRIAITLVAHDVDAFGQALFRSCLESLEGYADQIVILDHCLGDATRAMIDGLQSRLPIEFFDGHDQRDLQVLQQLAVAATHAGMDYLHPVESDHIYLPSSLQSLRELLAQDTPLQVSGMQVHCLIEPFLVESRVGRILLGRRDHALAITGSAGENRRPSGETVAGPGVYLHLGDCRPQWQTFLGWLRDCQRQTGSVQQFQSELINGVPQPWFRDGRTPDTILEPARPRLLPYTEVFPPAVRPWLESFAQSHLSWRAWLTQLVDHSRWEEWQALRATCGSWEATVPMVLQRWTNQPSNAPSPAMPTPRSATAAATE